MGLVRSVSVLAIGLAVSAILLAGCGNPATPTPVPPVTAEPTITCPASQTLQSPDGRALAVSFAAPIAANGQAPLGTVCAPQSGSLFPVGQQTVTCTVTDALKRASSCLFTVTVTSPPPKLAATTFLSFGDSITWGEDGSNGITASRELLSARVHPAVQVPAAEQYPNILQQSLAVRYKTQTPSVTNAGKPGEAAGGADIPTALVRFIGLVGNKQYSTVLIMEGSNDIFYADPFAEQPAIDAMRAMLRYAKALSVRPYLATIPPMNPSRSACTPVCRGNGFALVDGLNDQIRTLASVEGVTLVDVNQAFNGNLALIGPDGLHPNASGYAKIADTFFKAITQTLEVASVSHGGVLSQRVQRSLHDK